MAEVKVVKYKVDDLIFDPLNPRLPTGRRDDSEKEILEYMIKNENVFDLMTSIGEQGYFAGEPLLIIKSNTHKEKYEVVEGNRRLAALKLLNYPSSVSFKKRSIDEIIHNASHAIPTEVDAILYDSRSEILDYLGYRHITGVDQWDSLAKARFLSQLKENHLDSGVSNESEVYYDLAKLIGSRSDYVKKLINGYQLYLKIEDENFYNIPSLNEETFSFSLLTTAASYSNIRDQFLNIREENNSLSFSDEGLEKLTTWLFKEDQQGRTRIPESRDLNVFNAVVASPRALEVFEKGESLTDSSVFTDEPLKSFENLLTGAFQKLKLAKETIQSVKEVESSQMELLEELKTLINDLEALSGLRLKSKKKNV